MTNKKERINHELTTRKPDIFIFTEHGQNEYRLKNVRVPEYSLANGFSGVSHQKRGVAIYNNEEVENDIASLNIDNRSIELTYEITCVSLRIKKN